MQKYKSVLEISNKFLFFCRFQDDNDYVNGIFCKQLSAMLNYQLLIPKSACWSSTSFSIFAFCSGVNS